MCAIRGTFSSSPSWSRRWTCTWLVVPLLALVCGACGIDPQKIPSHKLFADDGEQLRADGPVSFAVVGNLRDPVPLVERWFTKRAVHPGVADDVAMDLETQAAVHDLAFVTLMGDGVRRSSTRQWKRFDQRMRNVIEGESFPDTPRSRLLSLPVVGEGEFRGDRWLQGLEGAYPGVGADIGYNRVGGWCSFDLEVGGEPWRFLVLDTNKKALGPRWVEQLRWIPEVVSSDDFEHLVIFMHHPLYTLGQGVPVNHDGAPAELLELVDENIGFMKLRLVFSADPPTTEVYTEGGRFGTLHVVAGGGGAPAVDLQRWGAAEEAGVEALKLEPIFDLAMLNTFLARIDEQDIPDNVIDAARAEGSYEGFPGVFDARYFPLHGYWIVTVSGETVRLVFRIWNSDGTFSDVYQADYAGEDEGWRIGE